MKAIINVGIIRETEKAIKVSFWSSSNYRGSLKAEKYYVSTNWIPKSQVKILKEYESISFYKTYHNLKCNAYGTISDGIVKTHKVTKHMTLELPKWLYLDKMTYGLNIN